MNEMNEDIKTEFGIMDSEKTEKDTEKKARRSSILKPQKPRNPLSTLDFTEANPDNTLARAARRVSFASSNFVKPFAADPEKNTIWDNTYEEEINHTDSTKSSYEQTQEAKSNDILNFTSVALDSAGNCFNESPPAKISMHYICEGDINPVLLQDEIVNKTSNDTFMEIGPFNKNKKNNHSFRNISLITPLNESPNITLCNNSYICLQKTIDETNVIDKENINPIINDPSLVIPIEENLQRSTKLKDNASNMINPNFFLAENLDITNYSELSNETIDEQIRVSQCDMELTKPISVTNIKRNIHDETNTINIKNKTVHIVEDMEITKTLDVHSKTIYFDQVENLDFTKVRDDASNLEVTCTSLVTTDISPDRNNRKKSETVYFEESKGSMEFTNSLPIQAIIIRNNLKPNKNDDKVVMELTTIPLSKESAIPDMTLKKRTNNSDRLKCETAFTPALVEHDCLRDASENDNNAINTFPIENEQINCNEIDMEFTGILPINKNSIKRNESSAAALKPNTDSRRKTIYFNEYDDDMDVTTVLPEKHENEIKTKITIYFSQSKEDLELTENLQPKKDENLLKITSEGINFTSTSDQNVTKERANKIYQIHQNQNEDVISSTIPSFKEDDKVNATHSKEKDNPVGENKTDLLLYNKQDYTGSENKQLNFSDDRNPDTPKKFDIVTLPYDDSNSNKSIKLNKSLENDNGTTKQMDFNMEPIQSCSANNNLRVQDSVQEKENCNRDKEIRENEDMKKVVIGMKRHSDNENEVVTAKKRISHIDQSTLQPSNNLIEGLSVAVDNLSAEDVIINKVDSVINREQKTNLQTSNLSNSNVLYSEPMKIKLKTSEFPPILDLPTTLNLHNLDDLNLNLIPVSTPHTSFHINLTNMSPCNEDTQQLIHATFSKPEFNVLSLDKRNISNKQPSDLLAKVKSSESSKTVENIDISQHNVITAKTFIVDDKTSTLKKCINNKADNVSFKINEKTYVKDSTQTSLINAIQAADDNPVEISHQRHVQLFDDPPVEESCCLRDLTPPDLVSSMLDNLSLLDNSANQINNAHLPLPEGNNPCGQYGSQQNTSIDSRNCHNYTLRSELVLTNVKKYLKHYEIEQNDDYTKLITMLKQCEENYNVIKDLGNELNHNMSKLHVIDLEEKHKQSLEEDCTSEGNLSKILQEERNVPCITGFVASKSLYDRVSETAKRSTNHWSLRKMKDDYYYFYTLFGTLPFKVHVHPDLGIVYSIETYTNLEDFSQPLCWYQLKLFQHKLKHENLLSVLGANFEILTLLDYVYMTMEELADFHTEFLGLEKTYGRTHHFRMNQDFSVSFEMLDVDLIIWWIISINLSVTGTICKEDVKAMSKLGEPVNEEDIKCIVENTPKGHKFLNNFIENVGEYLKRMERKIKFRRRNRY